MYKQECTRAHAEIHTHRVGGGAIFREHGNRTLASCAVPSIYMIYTPFRIYVCAPPRNVYTRYVQKCATPVLLPESAYSRTCPKDARMGAHARARYPRLPKLREAPDGNCPTSPPCHPCIQRAEFAYIRCHTHGPL